MEDTLGVKYSKMKKDLIIVLILVIMEDTLGEIVNVESVLIYSLNPCYNGRYSRRVSKFTKEECDMGLNPCYNGRYSRRTMI